jgi:Predicted ATPases of PP-loop superfamily
MHHLADPLTPIPIILSWSGGKDSALALHTLRRDPGYRVVGLLTSVTMGYDRISIHGVRRSLLEAQAKALGLPLHVVELEQASTNESYERAFHSGLHATADHHRGTAHIAFGDLFLQDVRAYRERLLAATNWTPVFPLWGLDTSLLARRFIDEGFSARLVCVDTTQLHADFAGRLFDNTLLADLPSTVDPCGERGEFHTFVSAGPGFRNPVAYAIGETLLRDARFMYCDLIA